MLSLPTDRLLENTAAKGMKRHRMAPQVLVYLFALTCLTGETINKTLLFFSSCYAALPAKSDRFE